RLRVREEQALRVPEPRGRRAAHLREALRPAGRGRARPDLAIYLQAPTEVLMKRIRARGRPEEAHLSEDYLAEVNRAYNHYFFHYSQSPLLVVNTAEVNFARSDQDLD